LKDFRTHCHEAARQAGGKVERVVDPFPANYSMAVIGFSDVSIAVLLNKLYPILGFAKPPTDGQIDFEYINSPLADFFKTQGTYNVAGAEELNRPLLRELCKDLTPNELKQVRYFRPTSVGAVVFNYWD
jgi:hypothetical protein